MSLQGGRRRDRTHAGFPCVPHDVPPYATEEAGDSVAHQLKEIAKARPHQIAVKDSSGALTYTALDRLSDRLAATLMDLAGNDAQIVALFADHNALAVAAILGALKANKAYVVIPTVYPTDRVKLLLEDSESVAVVTSARRESALRQAGIHRDALAIFEEIETKPSPSLPPTTCERDAPAALYYTSGSTGRPKAVLYSRRNLLRDMERKTRAYAISRGDRFALVSALAFRSSTTSVLGALLNGGSLYLHDLAADGLESLVDALDVERISVLQCVPTLFRALTGLVARDHVFEHLRLILIGGETVQPSDLERFRRHFRRDAFLRVAYGTTETCGPVTECFLGHEDLGPDVPVPVGRPVEGAGVLIQDEVGKPVAPGVVGQIVVRSGNLAQGYWRSPDLTRQRFIPDPDGGERRLYRTGDMGYVDDDGCLYVVGRADDQVQIRGQRVEPGEIEAALLTLKGVEHAAVIPETDARNETSLAAYVVVDEDTGFSASKLRSRLRDVLPLHMVPSKFVFLDAMPLTHSGKVARQALAEAARAGPKSNVPFDPPRTPTEEFLAGVWRELLEVDRVGRNDDFLELGGNSLLAGRVLGRVRQSLGVTVSFADMLDALSLARLAAVIDERTAPPGGRNPEPD